ncbi:hypothetical protein CAPTEDRAFT_219718 [Capitella teleta]|uniref:Uncharacterized protein n=1 Tax=Capitella teleta TaxID=283909 RepID=R7UVN4_CAPTE|nr:hypothetical protein CAPTEDRAFT_219718 [Capitella teleta]|eukprot:ELU10379.1 hypothetical protein CAPTEDRAFT_219718 [Capitella teleta]
MAAEASGGSAEIYLSEHDIANRGSVAFAAREEEEEDVEILPGARLGDPYTFSCRKNGKSVAATPILVDFRRILMTDAVEVIPGVSNRSLLHAVIGLFDVSLNEMTPDVLYSTVCSKYARTMMLIRDAKDAQFDINRRKFKFKRTKSEEEISFDEPDAETKDEEDVFKGEEEKPNTFENVYSDSDESESSDSESDEEDFSKGINAFLKEVKVRKAFRAKVSEVPLSNVGIEDRLVGALSFEKKYCKPSERIIHLTLIAVRKRLQQRWRAESIHGVKS